MPLISLLCLTIHANISNTVINKYEAIESPCLVAHSNLKYPVECPLFRKQLSTLSCKSFILTFNFGHKCTTNESNANHLKSIFNKVI